MKRNTPLPGNTISRLDALRGSQGTRQLAQRLSVSEFTLARALAGFPLQPNTAFCIETRLRELTEGNNAPVGESTV